MPARRLLATLLALVLGGLPVVAAAQPPRPFRIGVLFQGGAYAPVVEGLRGGLRELGLEEGRQVVLEVHDGKGDIEAIKVAARRLEEEKVDLIYSATTSVTLAVKQATVRVPIVFYVATDPVAIGLVETYRKPGGRLTGINTQYTDLTAKRLELLREMIPGLRRAVTFYDPANPSAQRSVKIARDAARRLHVTLVERTVTSVEALRAGLRALKPGDADALFYVSDAMVSSQAAYIVEIARTKRLPTMLQFEEQTRLAGGGLASYGVNVHMVGRLSAKPIQRIMQGARPADLPVEQLDRFHFVVNLRTARALGLTIPPSVLARADEVIE